MMEEKKGAGRMIPPIVMAGCLFIGMGLGFLRGNITAGTLIGLGSGFILMAILRYIIAARKKRATRNDGDQNS
jgi:hypothetical protein